MKVTRISDHYLSVGENQECINYLRIFCNFFTLGLIRTPKLYPCDQWHWSFDLNLGHKDI